ncbi:DUF4197 family protein [Paraurantiacibacter namhicola]|uniref:DUF4197 domain-containing protein n=1 Tax=Paraurantiacibacter namhicola TaxID=645517 RepID=A0A1C7DA21_9SPHN|nr:DUF4197 family protein [Paraurantiacibacter namhicola]ANU08339.1 hypothetical protein A6F65_02052 [Paraurantiacibacter namhicola]
MSQEILIGRRNFLRNTAGGALLGASAIALPGCAGLGGPLSFTDAIRRLLYLSSERAFARLVEPGGYWDGVVADVGLGNMLGLRGDILGSILTSAIFRDRLADAFSGFAAEAAYNVAPVVADTIRVIGLQNAIALVRGGPTAATGFLRENMGVSLVEAMVPELADAMRLSREPLVGQALSLISGLDVAGVADRFAGNIDTAIWTEMGVEEAAIRANPQATGDPTIIGVFGGAGLLGG